MNFWQDLRQQNKPFFCVAPMADVTDAAFRALITTYGKPDVMWTEFVSANGLMSQGREVLLRDLVYGEGERPIVAQLFSADPDKMEGAAALAASLGLFCCLRSCQKFIYYSNLYISLFANRTSRYRSTLFAL